LAGEKIKRFRKSEQQLFYDTGNVTYLWPVIQWIFWIFAYLTNSYQLIWNAKKIWYWKNTIHKKK
jgi:hypothetical protein